MQVISKVFLLGTLLFIASCIDSESEDDDRMADPGDYVESDRDNEQAASDPVDDNRNNGDPSASNCDAPGAPSKFLSFSTTNQGLIGGSSEELWYCINNPYSAIEAGLFVEDARYDNVLADVNIYDSNLSELDSTSSAFGSGGNNITTERVYESSSVNRLGDLPKGKLYVRFVVDGGKDYSVLFEIMEYRRGEFSWN